MHSKLVNAQICLQRVPPVSLLKVSQNSQTLGRFHVEQNINWLPWERFQFRKKRNIPVMGWGERTWDTKWQWSFREIPARKEHTVMRCTCTAGNLNSPLEGNKEKRQLTCNRCLLNEEIRKDAPWRKAEKFIPLVCRYRDPPPGRIPLRTRSRQVCEGWSPRRTWGRTPVRPPPHPPSVQSSKPTKQKNGFD